MEKLVGRVMILPSHYI